MKTEIYIDGGFRRGTEVLKALAYGASMVFVGTPIVWALHKNGKDGVKEAIEIITDEL